jgi:tRNA pseudouridine55 synthase
VEKKKFNFVTGEFVLIDKEVGWTSFDVVNKIRCSLKPLKVKVGHAGTLDPLATGLLIVCTGKMTKEISLFQSQNKVYEATMKLGITTPSFDLGTEIDGDFPYDHVTDKFVHDASTYFIGNIMQVPPIYSALKQNGERLYQKARRGEVVEISSREVVIYNLDIISIDLPYVKFRVECSKGTYIRSLVSDFGKKLNSGACLISLRRTRIGDYSIDNAHKVNDFLDEACEYKDVKVA